MKDHRVASRGIPDSFLHKMAGLLGDEYPQFESSLQQSSKIGFRVNTIKLPIDAFIKRTPYKLSPLPWCSSGFTLGEETSENGFFPRGKHPDHLAGLYYLQEPSAMAVAEILAPMPGEKVLDLAAAPGGKATHIASLMQNQGMLVANEIHPKRVWDLVENLERCGVAHAIVTSETPVRLADRFTEYFDRVLIDAPCSGEGMFRKAEIARQEWKPEMVFSCALRQADILEHAAKMVKPGGYMAYTTCTYSPEENEGVISAFLQAHAEFEILSTAIHQGFDRGRPEWIGLPLENELKRAIRMWPHHSPGEGHFIALLKKNRPAACEYRESKYREKKTSGSPITAKDTRSFWNFFHDFIEENLDHSFDQRRIMIEGSYVYYQPEEVPNLGGLKVIRPGWWLGSVRKERFIPSQALAMGISSAEFRSTLRLNASDKRVNAYLAGESFVSQGEDGWVLVNLDGFSLGWARRAQDVLKNYYPHGLRVHL